MADNIQLDSGTGGAILAAAQLSISGDTADVQMIGCGILSGSEGSWTYSQFVGGAGAVAAGVQRVTLASDDPAVVDLAAIEVLITAGNVDLAAIEVLLTGIDADTDAIKTSVQIMDDWDESDRAKVNIIAGQAGIAAGAGAVGVTVPRVTLASDDPGVALLATIDADTSAIKTAVELIDNAISGSEMQVDVVTSALPTGAATEATLAAIAGYLDTEVAALVTAAQLLDNCIAGSEAQVDVVTSALPSGASTEATLSTLNGKVTACNTGAVVISSGTITTITNTVTVSGTVTANLSATDNAVLDAIQAAVEIIDDWDESDRAKVNIIAGQAGVAAGAGAVGATVPRVTLASDDPAVTALQIMDDWDDSNDNCKMIAQSRYVMYGTERCEVQQFHVVTSTSGATVVSAPAAGKRVMFLSLVIMGLSATETNVHLETGTTNTDCFGDSTNPIPIAVDADGNNTAGVVLPWNPGGWFKSADSAESVEVVLSAAQPVLICGNYIAYTA